MRTIRMVTSQEKEEKMSDSRRTLLSSFRDERGEAGIGATIGAIVAVVFALWAVWIIADLVTSRSTPKAGEIGVVRNGSAKAWIPDWFDNRNIRGVIQNGSGNSWIGLGSNVHYYPVSTQQRFFTMRTCYDREDKNHTNPVVCQGADGLAIQVPTSDGVEATISGTFYLNTTFDNSEQGEKILKAFDEQFATRTFEGKHPFDGTQGWKNFLAAIIEPIIQNNMRQTVSGIQCAELVSSCALVQNSGNQGFAAITQGEANVQQVETSINEKLNEDLKKTLGKKYFQNVQFRLSKVELPLKIQEAIDSAQAAFARVSESQAEVKKSQYEARANEIRQEGYNKCPTCAAIDQTKAIPDTIRVWAPGSKAAIAVGGK